MVPEPTPMAGTHAHGESCIDSIQFFLILFRQSLNYIIACQEKMMTNDAFNVKCTKQYGGDTIQKLMTSHDIMAVVGTMRKCVNQYKKTTT